MRDQVKSLLVDALQVCASLLISNVVSSDEDEREKRLNDAWRNITDDLTQLIPAHQAGHK